MARSSSVVFPAPGELTRLSATISRPASHARHLAAIASFFARMRVSKFEATVGILVRVIVIAVIMRMRVAVIMPVRMP